MTPTIVVILLCMFGFDPSQGNSIDAKVLDRIKNMTAFQLDQELPKQRLADWLGQLVGPTAKVLWGVNDCGEQTGSAADSARDMPFCVGAVADLLDGRKIQLLIYAGTLKRGLADKPKVFDITIKDGRLLHDVPRLHNLPSMLKSIKPKKNAKTVKTGKPGTLQAPG